MHFHHSYYYYYRIHTRFKPTDDKKATIAQISYKKAIIIQLKES